MQKKYVKSNFNNIMYISDDKTIEDLNGIEEQL